MDILNIIKKTLKKKKETIILDLYIKDYDKSNFYFAVVFNKKIEKFKVLYVPIDAIDCESNIEEYFCYQFIFIHTVNYLLETINSIDNSEMNLIRDNSEMNSYYIEINTNVDSKESKYTFTQFIDKDFKFLFEIIVTLFEHLPNIVNELCSKILSEFNDNSEKFKYTGSYDFDFENNKLEDLFDEKVIKNCKYKFTDIEFLEGVGERYYSIINDKIIIIDFSKFNNLINISSPNYYSLGEEVYIIMKAIFDKIEKRFYRLMVANDKQDFLEDRANYYLCYGVEDDFFKVVNSNNEKLELDLLKKERVKILNPDRELEEKLKSYLSEKYEDKLVDEIINYTFMR